MFNAIRFLKLAGAVPVAALLCFLTPFAAEAASVKHAVRSVMPSVVEVHVLDESGKAVSGGSGIIASRSGLIVTNFHVIDKATRARVILGDGEMVRVVGVRVVDPERDFAILQVEAGNLPAAVLGDSDKLESGDEVIAIGAPLGLSKTTTIGIVSQIRRLEGYRLVQHTAAISPGSSGGPLLNEMGEVVGINTFLLKDGQALFFALPINYVSYALAHLPKEMVTLRDLAEAQAALEASKRKKATDEFLSKNFFKYEDPDGLFNLVLPKTWRVQRSITFDREGNATLLFMASDPDAELAKLNGWLSAGIRIRMVIPAKGRQWNSAAQLAWVKDYIAASMKGYAKVIPGEPSKETWANREAVEMVMGGTAAGLSEPELASLALVPNSDVLTAIEITLPASQKDLFELLHTIFQKSFSLGS